MNNYLFRGKRVDSVDWVEGYLLPDYTTTKYYVTKVGVFCAGVVPETVGMWSLLTDKNGAKVFEGDIISKDDCTGIVGFGRYKEDGVENVGFYVKWEHHEDFCGALAHWIETIGAVVVGNIYDNPELAEGN